MFDIAFQKQKGDTKMPHNRKVNGKAVVRGSDMRGSWSVSIIADWLYKDIYSKCCTFDKLIMCHFVWYSIEQKLHTTLHTTFTCLWPVPTHQPALLYNMTASNPESWKVTNPYISSNCWSCRITGLRNTLKEFALFHVHELVIDWCCCDWQGRENMLLTSGEQESFALLDSCIITCCSTW